jgi:hypothetical protein
MLIAERFFSKTSQLALGDLDFLLIEKISQFLHGNFIFMGEFLRQGAGNFSILDCFIQLGDNLFTFQSPILLQPTFPSSKETVWLLENWNSSFMPSHPG